MNESSLNPVSVPEPVGKEKITGWLAFFLIVFVGLGSVLSLVMSCLDNSTGSYQWNPEIGDVAFAVIYSIVGAVTIMAFYSRQSDAVCLARIYIVLCFLSNALVLCLSDHDADTPRELRNMLKSLVWCVVWFVFTYKSEQINRLFPRQMRRSRLRDWLLLAAAIIVPTYFVINALKDSDIDYRAVEEANIASLELSEGQFTDGKVVFTLPENFVCEEQITDSGIRYFSAEDSVYGTEITVISDYDSDASKKNFYEYWTNWRSDITKEYKTEVLSDESYQYNGWTVFYKRLAIKAENPIDWEFALVFDPESGKVCLMSSYCASENESTITSVLPDLRFL